MTTETHKDFNEVFLNKKIKGVLVDFDNTLYEYDPCHKVGLEASYSRYSAFYKNVSYEKFIEMYKKAQDLVKPKTHEQAASHSRLLYFQKMVEMQEGKTNIENIFALEEAYWSNFQKKIVLQKYLVDFLTNCKKNGIKVCLITDLTTSVQFRKITDAGVDKLIDFVVTSEEAGAEKPNSSIFYLALDKLGVSSDEVIMIGDNKIKDIDGASKLGIEAYLV